MQKEIYAEPDKNKKMKLYKDWLASRANPPPEPTNTMTLDDYKLTMNGNEPASKNGKGEVVAKEEKPDILSQKKKEK